MAGNFNISRFKSEVSARGGFSRGVFFECQIQVTQKSQSSSDHLPVFNDPDEMIICKSTKIPSDLIDPVELRYFTRAVRIPGARQFQPITLTFYNTVNYSLLSKFKNWIELLNSWENNGRNGDTQYQYSELFGEMQLVQFHNDGQMSAKQLLDLAINTGISVAQTAASRVNPVLGSVADTIGDQYTRPVDANNPTIATYKFHKIYPTSITGLDFSYDDDGSYQTFDVEFQYLNMEFIKGTPTSAKGTAALIDRGIGALPGRNRRNG